MHYVDEGQGRPVVLVHGTPTWGFEWRHVIADLSRICRVIVPDHLGFGLSERPADADYRPEAHAARFAAFMDRVTGPEPVSLVVHDFGGPIALAWADASGPRADADRRELVDVVLRGRPGDAAPRRHGARHAGPPPVPPRQRLAAPDHAYADRRRLTRAIHRQYLGAFPDADARERVLFALAKALLGSSAFYADLWSRRAALAGVDLLFVWGMRDTAFVRGSSNAGSRPSRKRASRKSPTPATGRTRNSPMP